MAKCHTIFKLRAAPIRAAPIDEAGGASIPAGGRFWPVVACRDRQLPTQQPLVEPSELLTTREPASGSHYLPLPDLGVRAVSPSWRSRNGDGLLSIPTFLQTKSMDHWSWSHQNPKMETDVEGLK